MLGGIALRHRLDGHLRRLGHIGYGVRPVARGRGLATWAIGQMLNDARTLGLDRVLIVCETDNVGSIKAIERSGGAFECVDESEKYGALRRHWISL